MHPKLLPRPGVWSLNTSYVGAAGLHSENSPAARARKASVDNRLNKVISVLKDMERKEFQQLDKSKREIQKSMLAYTEKVKKINAKRHFFETSSNTSTTPELSSDRSSKTSSSNKEDSFRRSTLLPVKSRRVSLPKIGLTNKLIKNKRRNSSFSDSETVVNPITRKTTRVSHTFPSTSKTINSSDDDDDAYNTIFENDKQNEKQEGDYLKISPFPYESYDENVASSFTSRRSSFSKSPVQSRKRINYKQYKEEKELERESILARKKSMTDHDPFDHRKEIQRQQAKQRRETFLIEKARQDALKNKKDVYNTFCYSFAMEELLKKSDPLAYIASEEDFVAKVEVDQNGIIKQTLGPAVLSIMGVDELNNYQGMRIKWSAKYRRQTNEESESSDEESFLPPIVVGGRKHSIAREISRSDTIHRKNSIARELSRSDSIQHDFSRRQSVSCDSTQEQIPKLHFEPHSTVSARQRRKGLRKKKATLVT